MIDALRRQFDLAWALADLHLSALTADDFGWEPADLVWTMRRGPHGTWTPDWADSEPDPIPVPTVGWLSWHMIFWWSSALDALAGRPPRTPLEIGWPGPNGAVDEIRALHARWVEQLDTLTEADLAAPSTFPWGPDTDRTVGDTVLWLNVELAKNAAEIGQLRLLRAATR